MSGYARTLPLDRRERDRTWPAWEPADVLPMQEPPKGLLLRSNADIEASSRWTGRRVDDPHYFMALRFGQVVR